MVKRVSLYCWMALSLNAQGWQQWGQNPRLSGAAPVVGQRLDRVFGQFQYDVLVDQIRQDTGGALLVHYMAPLVDGEDVFTMSRGDSH